MNKEVCLEDKPVPSGVEKRYWRAAITPRDCKAEWRCAVLECILWRALTATCRAHDISAASASNRDAFACLYVLWHLYALGTTILFLHAMSRAALQVSIGKRSKG